MAENPWPVQGVDHASLMDRVYRHQRHFYDATRKFYLLGRDQLIANLKVPTGGDVLEIGCGTGRNLVKVAKTYPSANLYGIDISEEMLATARRATQKAHIAHRAQLERADAAQFDPQALFGLNGFDRIFVSYALSMIPSWQFVIGEALKHLKPGGELHIVDFGDLLGLPRWCKRALYKWLYWYHVTPRNDLFHVCVRKAAYHNATHEEHILYRGFAWHSIIRAASPK